MFIYFILCIHTVLLKWLPTVRDGMVYSLMNDVEKFTSVNLMYLNDLFLSFLLMLVQR